MPKTFPTLRGKYFYCTANGTRAHITVVERPTYLDKKISKTLCNMTGELVHLGNRLVNDFQSRQLGVNIAEVCEECLLWYEEKKDDETQLKPFPAKGQKRTRSKPIQC